MTIVNVSVPKTQLFALFIHEGYKNIGKIFIRIFQKFLKPPFLVWVEVLVPQFEELNQPNCLAYGDGSIISTR